MRSLRLMQPRTTLAAQFSSFATLEADRFSGWMADPRLIRSMERQVQNVTDQADATDRFWAIYWYRLWDDQSHRFAEEHLVAYLQEACFWMARRLHRHIRQSDGSAQMNLSDLFQMAATEIRPMLKKFDPATSGNLQGFAKVSLDFRVKGQLRRQHLAGFCSDWSLLRQTSQKGLSSALTQLGLGADAIEQRRLLLMGYKAIYQGQPDSTGRLPEPNLEELKAIADFYNQQRSSQLTQVSASLDGAQVLKQLLEASKAIRQSLYPSFASLNVKPFNASEGESVESLDLLPDSKHSSLLAEMLENEEHQSQAKRWEQLRDLLRQQFEQFNEQVQEILCLTYHQGLSQTEVKHRTGLSQPTVSRRLRKAQEQMVEAILEQAGGMNNFSEPRRLKEVSHQLDVCLKVYLSELGCCHDS